MLEISHIVCMRNNNDVIHPSLLYPWICTEMYKRYLLTVCSTNLGGFRDREEFPFDQKIVKFNIIKRTAEKIVDSLIFIQFFYRRIRTRNNDNNWILTKSVICECLELLWESWLQVVLEESIYADHYEHKVLVAAEWALIITSLCNNP